MKRLLNVALWGLLKYFRRHARPGWFIWHVFGMKRP